MNTICNAVGEERAPAESCAIQLLFTLNAPLKDIKDQSSRRHWPMAATIAPGSLAMQGLKMKTDDADLLYYAGMAAMITRKPKESREHFARYLDVSNTLDAKMEERAQVRRLMPAVPPVTMARRGTGRPELALGQLLAQGSFLLTRQPGFPAAYRPCRRLQQAEDHL